MSVLSFLGGFSQRMSDNWKEDRDAMEVQIRDASNFYRTEGSRRLEERRERKNALQQRFKTVKLLTGDTQYSKDIASAAIQLDDDSYTDFLARLKKSADEVGTLDAKKLQELGLIGAEFKPTDITVDTAVGNVMGVFDKSSVADTKTLGTTAEGLRRHFGTLTPKEIERSAREQAAGVLGVGAAELSAITSGDLTFGDASTGVNLGIVDPLAKEERETRKTVAETARLQLASAQRTAEQEKRDAVPKTRFDPVTKLELPDKYNAKEWKEWLTNRANEVQIAAAEDKPLTMLQQNRYNTKVKQGLVAKFGGTVDVQSGIWTTKTQDTAEANNLQRLASLLTSKVVSHANGYSALSGSRDTYFNTLTSEAFATIINGINDSDPQSRSDIDKQIIQLLTDNPDFKTRLEVTSAASQPPPVVARTPTAGEEVASQAVTATAQQGGEAVAALTENAAAVKKLNDQWFAARKESKGDKAAIGNFLVNSGAFTIGRGIAGLGSSGNTIIEQSKIMDAMLGELRREGKDLLDLSATELLELYDRYK